MANQRNQSLPVDRSAFAGYRFPPEVIMLAVRWYLRYRLSYRDVEEPASTNHVSARSGCVDE